MKKSLKHLLAASVLTVGFASAAQAATVDVYITGSSAFRAAVTNAISRLLTGPKAAYVGADAPTSGLAGATQQLITGVGAGTGLSASNTYFFHTCWTGSLGGISTLVFNVPPVVPAGSKNPYLPDSVSSQATSVTLSNGSFGSNPAGGFGLGTATDFTNVTPPALPAGGRNADAAFSDVFQTSTKFQSVSLAGATVAGSGSTANADGIVGVVPFVFVANPDLTSYKTAAAQPDGTHEITNITATAAKQLYASGLDLSVLTGNEADSNAEAGQVLPVGRDADSGTRFTTFAETGFNPIGGTNEPQQYTVTKSGSKITIALVPAINLFAGTAAELDFTSGQSGASSGGTERGYLEIPGTSGTVTGVTSSNPSYIVGTLGESDAIRIVATDASGASYLSYNGVAYATSPTTTSTTPFNRTALDQGLYTFWGYEHCYLDGSTQNASAVDAVAAAVRATDAPIAGELIKNMAVQRTAEGTAIGYVGTGSSTQ
jgi:hypothetical protein